MAVGAGRRAGGAAGWREGARAVVAGLKARPDLNGKHCTLLGYAPEAGRWRVWLDDGFGKALREENLEQPPEAEVIAQEAQLVKGARARVRSGGPLHPLPQPGLDGQSGTLVAYDAAEDCWCVTLDSGCCARLRPANLEALSVDDEWEVVDDVVEEAPVASPRQAVVPAGSAPAAPGSATCSAMTGATCAEAAAPPAPAPEPPTAPAPGNEMRRRFEAFLGTGQRLFVPDADQPPQPPPAEPQSAPAAVGHQEAQQEVGAGLPAAGAATFYQGWPRAAHGGLARRDPLLPDHSVPRASSREHGHPRGAVGPAGSGAAGQFPGPGAAIADAIQLQATAPPEPAVRSGGAPACPDLRQRFRGFLERGERLCIPGRLEATARPCASPSATHAHESETSVLASDPEPAVVTQTGQLPLQAGTRVRVSGLVARPEFNGKEGTLLELEVCTGRWKVVMDGGFGLNLRPCNVEPLGPASPPSSSSTAAAPSPGETQGPHAAPASAAAATTTAAPPAPPCFPGSRVRLRGLRRRTELNGQDGVVLEFCEAEGRWHVVMDDGAGVSVLEENLEVTGGLRVGSRARLRDGRGCTLRRALPGRGSWEVDVDGRFAEVMHVEHMMVAAGGPEARLLVRGDRVRVASLQARPELNGKLGTLGDFNEVEGRWAVRLDGDPLEKRIREVNLQPLE